MGQVQTVEITDKGAISGELKDGTKFTTQIPTALDSSALTTQLQSQHVEITAKQSSSDSSFLSLLLIFLPLILIGGLFLWSGRMASRAMTGGLSAIGRSRRKIIEAERPSTRFADVAGYEGCFSAAASPPTPCSRKNADRSPCTSPGTLWWQPSASTPTRSPRSPSRRCGSQPQPWCTRP
nr:hypothetical protein [Streptomyces sp. TLI_235]